VRTPIALLVLLLPVSASAQYAVSEPAGEPTEIEMSRARELYVGGGRMVREGRWADALTAFEEAYQISGIPAALFNAATTLRSMGRHRDSRDLFRQVLAIDGLDDETREQSEIRMREEAGRVALILLAGLGELPSARLELDGRIVEGPREDPVELETDPGEHAVAVLMEGHVPWREELALSDGDRATLHVELETLEELWQSPVLWTIVGVVLAGGAAAAAVLVNDAAQLSPRPMFDGVVVEL